MKKFITQIIKFILPLLFISILGVLLPTTPRASKSLIYANKQKDYMLQNTKPPRIIFVGGSNLSFGLNSQMIKDSLKINPINTGIQADIGLLYMIENVNQFVRSGDIVVLIPEYDQFFGELAYGSEGLLRTIFDVDIKKANLLNNKQLSNLIRHIPKYSLSKLNPREYFKIVESDVYSVNSFNLYGDVFSHWNMTRREFCPFDKIQGSLDLNIMERLKKFEYQLYKKNATLFISYPGLQNLSYSNSEFLIKQVEAEYKKNCFKILGTPERYIMQDSLLFNTPYHLNKKGVDLRTKMFIEDFKNYKKKM